MQAVYNVINNAWFVAISTGILSSLIVAFISRSILSRRDQREYLQKTTLANNDVLYALRPGVPEGFVPPPPIIKKMISAAARKYEVDESSMYNLDVISSELIKEVMDSSFISVHAKREFCEILGEIGEPERSGEIAASDSELDVSKLMASKEYRQQFVGAISLLAGSLTGVMAVVGWLDSSDGSFARANRILILAVPAIAALLAAFVSSYLRDIRRLRLRRVNIDLGPIQAELRGSINENESQEKTG